MTSHYVDLTVMPNPEISLPHLLGALYDRVHLALAEQQSDSLGVTFPKYSKKPRELGDTLRLHGSDQNLNRFFATNWLKGLRDHIQITDVRPVPDKVEHRVFKRRQFKTNVERLRRRRMKRKGETYEQVAKAIPTSAERQPDLPYIHLHSKSTQQAFCLFLERGTVQPAPQQGRFNTYGLSGAATLPWF